MTESNRSFGLMLERKQNMGTRYVTVTMMSRKDGENHPLGCGSNTWEWPKRFANLYLDGLGLYGFVTDHDRFDYIGYDLEFRDVYAVDADKARRMLAMLKKVNRQIDASKAYEPGDKLMAIAKALKLDFVVERVNPAKQFGSSWNDMDWRWMSVDEGRNRYRTLIAEARAEQAEATNGKAVAS